MSELKIIEIHPEIAELVSQNGGYCPCAFIHNKDTQCICKDFREQTTPGECYCGRFSKRYATEITEQP